jgi:hypothetical protein
MLLVDRTMSELARSGHYLDWYAIERALVAAGHSEENARVASGAPRRVAA